MYQIITTMYHTLVLHDARIARYLSMSVRVCRVNESRNVPRDIRRASFISS